MFSCKFCEIFKNIFFLKYAFGGCFWNKRKYIKSTVTLLRTNVLYFNCCRMTKSIETKRKIMVREKWPNTKISGLYFPVSRLNSKLSDTNVRIQSKYGKIREKTRYMNKFHAVYSIQNELTFSWRRSLSYRNRSNDCSAKQWTDFYMIGTSIMKELKWFSNSFITYTSLNCLKMRYNIICNLVFTHHSFLLTAQYFL